MNSKIKNISFLSAVIICLILPSAVPAQQPTARLGAQLFAQKMLPSLAGLGDVLPLDAVHARALSGTTFAAAGSIMLALAHPGSYETEQLLSPTTTVTSKIVLGRAKTLGVKIYEANGKQAYSFDELLKFFTKGVDHQLAQIGKNDLQITEELSAKELVILHSYTDLIAVAAYLIRYSDMELGASNLKDLFMSVTLLSEFAREITGTFEIYRGADTELFNTFKVKVFNFFSGKKVNKTDPFYSIEEATNALLYLGVMIWTKLHFQEHSADTKLSSAGSRFVENMLTLLETFGIWQEDRVKATRPNKIAFLLENPQFQTAALAFFSNLPEDTPGY